ncbi:NEDD4/BSD2 domain-containing protein [Rozella allomycis CSF55]|uniref:NEDD4/BSD2 domain-containing protein n=2 Tax=Rozella allomycis (strain CSF55) TaxID=988480 RepID=A0A075B5A6_ROZAC|nr:NEDD4/BSD2 domain-containing protein [Rozella allomycis CSF55]|eukprot:EPZ36910.1 NEDD4/BSD2 domain-containing protein [Rozella allomycis CSF55]
MTPPNPLEWTYRIFEEQQRFAESRGTLFVHGSSIKQGPQDLLPITEMEAESISQAPFEEPPKIDENPNDSNLKSLQRKLNRNLYFVTRNIESGGWTFPSEEISIVKPEKGLHEVSIDAVNNVCDKESATFFHMGREPLAQFNENIFYFKSQILRGKFAPKVQEYAWLTKEELEENIDKNVYNAVPTSEIPETSTHQETAQPMAPTSKDAVFVNIPAKPSPENSVKLDATGEIPPTYESVATDAVPPYTEPTININLVSEEMRDLVDGYPVGHPVTFLVSFFISVFFQTIGFVMSFVMASDHSGRFGSLAGFGLNLVLMVVSDYKSFFGDDNAMIFLNSFIGIFGLLIMVFSIRRYISMRKLVCNPVSPQAENV